MIEIVAPEEGMSLQRSLFLAGGITNCPDWQSDMVLMLSHTDLTLFNPRRRVWDMSDKNASSVQIEWEHRHLKKSKAILFWFPKETLCPITLFELGAWSNTAVPLFVGTHPDYQRRFDVIKQLSLVRPDVKVGNSLADLAYQIDDWLERERHLAVTAEVKPRAHICLREK